MDIKKFFRAVLLYFLGTGLFFMLFVLAYFIVFTQISAKPDKVKQILSSSGIYQKIPAVVYDDAVDSGSTSSASLPLKDAAVRQAALDTFSPGLVQKNIESALDGTYGWLDGITSQPEFNIDLKDAKDNFAKSLSGQAGKRLEGLSVCTEAQLRKIKQIDPFTIPCLPPGVSIGSLKKQVLQSAKGDDNFLKDTKFTPASLKDDSGKPVFDSYPDIPKAYQISLKLPYVLAVLCIIFGTSIVFISATKSDGFKKLTRLLAIAGIFVILAPIGIGRLTDSLLKTSSSDSVTTELVTPVVKELNNATSKVYYVMGAVYILLAIGAFLLYKKILPAEEKKVKNEVRSN